jgi:hypothetical protein
VSDNSLWEGGEGVGTARRESNQPFPLILKTATDGYFQGEWEREIRLEQRSRDLSPLPTFLQRKGGAETRCVPLSCKLINGTSRQSFGSTGHIWGRFKSADRSEI